MSKDNNDKHGAKMQPQAIGQSLVAALPITN
nr:MAG TPA: hypothetical protein [Caudoviricetes sp.]